MNGQLGKFAIQPDQMQALNPILILVFIPIFETVVYPLFAKCHLLKRLEKCSNVEFVIGMSLSELYTSELVLKNELLCYMMHILYILVLLSKFKITSKVCIIRRSHCHKSGLY